MIKNKEPLSMAEASKYLQKGNTNPEVKRFMKKFVKLKFKEAEEMKENLKKLDLMKLGEKDIVKIIDLMPENAEELNKIFVDISLDEDETKKILEIVKQFK